MHELQSLQMVFGRRRKMEAAMGSDVFRDTRKLSRGQMEEDLLIVEFDSGWEMMKETAARFE